MFIRLGSFINEAATKKKRIPLSSVNGSREGQMNSGFSVFLIAWENNFTLVSSRNDVEERARKFHTDDVSLSRTG